MTPDGRSAPVDLPHPPTHATQRELLAAAKRGDRAAREEVIERNLRLVQSIISRFSYRLGTGSGVDADDLFQVGCLGLIKAVEGFDVNRTVRFSTYAVPVIVGEIRRYLREQHPIRVSRGLRELGFRVADCRERLTQQWGRSPSIDEIASALHLPREEAVAALGALQSPDTLDRPLDREGDGPAAEWPDDPMGGEGAFSRLVDSLALRQLLDGMGEWEKKLVTMRYLEGRSQTEVAEALGVSQAHVSRNERKILDRLRKLLA